MLSSSGNFKREVLKAIATGIPDDSRGVFAREDARGNLSSI
jgi:hypothetical protein